ncbi:transcriptional Coactivator p15-domain-containing protein [Podospora fimiseda]|uniref:Transcriptional Coactivator p15-domain-containing protein n=1 Tax=Podospora fimiseda TaxID=252190 RepID=A0AAN7BVC7_9PEZI|nr:transcriptional Coactivator p15-domain-containing protein [Podospora fimiseda]
MSYTRKRGIQLDNDEEIPIKRAKGSKRRIQLDDDDSSEDVPMKKAAVAQKATASSKVRNPEPAQGTDAEGNNYWELGNNRRIGPSKFKNSTLVNIREYYTAADGEVRPGKKGISLSLDQYKALLKVIPQLNEELRSQGQEVDDPVVASSSSTRAAVNSEKPGKSKKVKKSNIEVTSDEDEDEHDEMEEDNEDDDI